MYILLPPLCFSLHNHNVCSAYSIASAFSHSIWWRDEKKKRKKKFERLGSFEIRAPADCGCIELYTVGSLFLSLLIYITDAV